MFSATFVLTLERSKPQKAMNDAISHIPDDMKQQIGKKFRVFTFIVALLLLIANIVISTTSDSSHQAPTSYYLLI